MEKIVPGKFVSLIYDLYAVNEDGSEQLVHQSDPSDPEKIIFGVTQGVIRPLEEALEDKEKGGEFDVVANADEAFGPYDPNQVMSLDKDMFVIDGKFDDKVVAVGNYVPMLTSEGYRINGLVLEITDDKVKMDFNHPLAGKKLRFKGSVLDVRDATDDELHIATSHGCGGCGCGDGGCGCGDSSEGGCGCGDNSGSSCGCNGCGN
ncbi:MAG: peptidylprolyl isomerase [Muribaculaceae bacterium]|nr:peptidylprolyl isomerase [Muribaculaceae bacterium]